MSEAKGLPSRYFRVIVLAVVVTVVGFWVGRHIDTLGNVLKVIIGFGAVVLIHEFGHFVVAKLSGIKVEAFSIGFPPTLVGIQRTGKGYRVRFLPKFSPKEEEGSGHGVWGFTVGQKAKPGETEYRVGLVPFGGYNKMLGQEDTGPVKASQDPRSYANKPVGVRMGVIAAGVFLNAISAILIFMVVFLVGIMLTPPVVGGVKAGSPAARAGLNAGDEIIEIAGKSKNLEFRNILMAAILSEQDEKVALKVKRGDEVIDFAIAAERMPTPRGEMRLFGIDWPMTLTIAELSGVNARLKKTELLPGDRIKVIDGREVQTHWKLMEVVENAFAPSVTVLAERTDPVSKEVKLIESQLKLTLNLGEGQGEPESGLGHIYSLVPRLKVAEVLREPNSSEAGPYLDSGDVILAIGGVENPAYQEMREVVAEYEDRKLPVRVLRGEQGGSERTITVTVVPKRVADSNQVVIGINLELDLERAVVAKTIAEEGSVALAIPRGAVITKVDGVGVSNFFDVAREIGRCAGERITFDWRLDEQVAGDVAFDVGGGEDFVAVKTTFAEVVPFEPLQMLYRASGPREAVAAACRKAVTVIVQTYVGMLRMMEGLVGRRELTGPVGIITMSYQIAAEEPLIYYVNFLGVISVLLAVFNFLPIPPFDGGHIVLLSVEKIKGSALSERAQEAIAYAGVVFIIALFLYLTFNDIVNIFFR